MSENRKETASILLKFPGKKDEKLSEKIELFSAELWKARQGLFRIRKGGKWLDLSNGKKRFFSLSQVAKLIAECLGADALEYESKPRLAHPSNVIVPFSAPDNACTTTRGWTMAPIYQGPDGRWRVWVYTDEPKEFFVSEVVESKPKRGRALYF